MSHTWCCNVSTMLTLGDAFCSSSCAPGTGLGPFLAACMALGTATGLRASFSCATAHAKPLCRSSLTAGSQEGLLTYRRGNAGSLVRSPGGRLGAASGVHLQRPGEWDRRIQWRPIRHFRLRPHSGRLVDGLRHAPAHWSSYFPTCLGICIPQSTQPSTPPPTG